MSSRLAANIFSSRIMPRVQLLRKALRPLVIGGVFGICSTCSTVCCGDATVALETNETNAAGDTPSTAETTNGSKILVQTVQHAAATLDACSSAERSGVLTLACDLASIGGGIAVVEKALQETSKGVFRSLLSDACCAATQLLLTPSVTALGAITSSVETAACDGMDVNVARQALSPLESTALTSALVNMYTHFIGQTDLRTCATSFAVEVGSKGANQLVADLLASATPAGDFAAPVGRVVVSTAIDTVNVMRTGDIERLGKNFGLNTIQTTCGVAGPAVLSSLFGPAAPIAFAVTAIASSHVCRETAKAVTPLGRATQYETRQQYGPSEAETPVEDVVSLTASLAALTAVVLSVLPDGSIEGGLRELRCRKSMTSPSNA